MYIYIYIPSLKNGTCSHDPCWLICSRACPPRAAAKFTKLKELRSPSAIETEVSSPGIPNSWIVYDSL